MTYYVLLGIVQGITEFLPVSSSGHLVLAQWLLGWSPPGVALEAVVHLGTLVAVLVFFRRDLYRLLRAVTRGGGKERAYIGLLVLGTVPVVALGLTARGAVERAFGAPSLVGAMLLLTAAALIIGDLCASRAQRSEPRVSNALAAGLGQALALLPGVSRSGTTISAGIASGLRPMEAARFSFLLSIPAILGAGVWELFLEPGRPPLSPEESWGMVVAGVAALLSGLVAIRLLLLVVRRRRLRWFAGYCVLVGLATLIAQLV